MLKNINNYEIDYSNEIGVSDLIYELDNSSDFSIYEIPNDTNDTSFVNVLIKIKRKVE